MRRVPMDRQVRLHRIGIVPALILETWIPSPPERCFELSLSVDAHTASMRGSGEKIIAGLTTGSMSLDDTVTWRAKHFGIPFTMTSRISEYETPSRFVDEQISGPFRRWWHEHRFEDANGGTQMTDRIEFEAPAGPIGRAINRLVLTGYMTRLIEQRNSWLVDALTPAGK